MLSATRRVVEGVWLGRAGQGAVLSSYILAEAAVLEGKPAIGMPEFGAERRGAPVRAFNRIVARPLPGDANILPRTPISLADFLVVMDPHLVSARHLVPSLREGAVVVVNTSRTPQETSRLLGVEGVRVFVVNATEMALRHVGRAVV
ncbi:MAG: 2-oxoacid:acceptor oxidoreductase family protein, partial [Fervidicoccaceae archaeon]